MRAGPWWACFTDKNNLVLANEFQPPRKTSDVSKRLSTSTTLDEEQLRIIVVQLKVQSAH